MNKYEEIEIVDIETTIKVVVIGTQNTGKSSLCTDLSSSSSSSSCIFELKKSYSSFSSSSTFNVCFVVSELNSFLVSDLSSSLLTKKCPICIVFVFATDSRVSFESIALYWKSILGFFKSGLDEKVFSPLVLLVQTKVDLILKNRDMEKVSAFEAESLSRAMNAKLFRTCAKNGLGIDGLFEEIANYCFHLKEIMHPSVSLPCDSIEDVCLSVDDLISKKHLHVEILDDEEDDTKINTPFVEKENIGNMIPYKTKIKELFEKKGGKNETDLELKEVIESYSIEKEEDNNIIDSMATVSDDLEISHIVK